MDRSPSIVGYIAIAALNVMALAGVVHFTGLEFGHQRRPGVDMRAEVLPAAAALDGLAGQGVLKVVNESGRSVELRLIGPAFTDSRTIVVPSWKDGRVFGLTPGVWSARFCMGSQCAELDDTLRFSETIVDETLQRNVAVIRFGPSPREWPASHPISPEEFAAE